MTEDIQELLSRFFHISRLVSLVQEVIINYVNISVFSLQEENMSVSQYRDFVSNSTSCWDDGSDAYLRISIGQYYASRTEILGTLEGDPLRPRVSS